MSEQIHHKCDMCGKQIDRELPCMISFVTEDSTQIAFKLNGKERFSTWGRIDFCDSRCFSKFLAAYQKEEKMATVWVTKDGGHNYEAAEEFGEVQFLFDRTPPFGDTAAIKEQLDSRNIRSDDSLLASGPLFVNMVGTVWWKERFGRVRVLVFDARDERYRERVL